MTLIQDRLLSIATDPLLSFKQKSRQFALSADEQLPYLSLSDGLSTALESRVVCDMFEGHAPFKPRYVLPDYALFLKQGSCYLELPPADTLDEALTYLGILYHHVPSVTDLPVFLGHIDRLLLPYIDDVSDAQLYQKLKLFWIQLDRTLPDAFVHANIGPEDNRIVRAILAIEAELKQTVPNLTFMYDPAITSDDLLRAVTDTLCQCNKPHIANNPLHEAQFTDTGFGIVSCYNALSLGGGANTLVRLNLRKVAEQSDSLEDFFAHQLPRYSDLMFELIEARTDFLHNRSGFFNSFLVSEGLIHEDRFSPMWGVFGLAQAVNHLGSLANKQGSYGNSEWHNALAPRISQALSDIVTETFVTFGYKNRALLHSQAGISTDSEETPGTRIPYGEEPDIISHVKIAASHHAYYPSGISDVLQLDQTVVDNPESVFQLCKGALQIGMREFTVNIAHQDLVRVTGFMIKRSDIEKLQAEGSRSNTAALGVEAVEKTGILNRRPRVVSDELTVSDYQ